jgi:hypothetical protein
LWPILISFPVHQKRPGLFPGDSRLVQGRREKTSASPQWQAGRGGEEAKVRDLQLSYYICSQTVDKGEGRGALLGLKRIKKGKSNT